jgi:hypothetical protein
VRDGFLTGRATTSLDKLNADFAVWLNQYHHTQHRGLAMSPLSRKLTDAGPALKQLAPTQDIDDIFRMEHNARVGSDGCIRLFNTRFEVPAAMPGSHITVYYLPWNQDSVFIGPDKLRLKPLDAKRNALRFDKPRRGDSARKETDQ